MTPGMPISGSGVGSGADSVAVLDADPGRAVGLPNFAYTQRPILERERSQVLAPAWTCVGIEDDAPGAGDVYVTTAAGQPLIMVRDGDGRLRVFHNVCRHRGTRLVAASGRCSALVCPYHAWSYSLDGRLLRTPNFGGAGVHQQEGFDRSDYGLVSVRSGTWNALVFVNLDGQAPPLSSWLAPLARRWRHFDFSRLRYGASDTLEVAANWKLVSENFLESYHLPTVHGGLSRYSPLEDHELILEGDSFFGQRSNHYQPVDAASLTLPTFPGLSAEQSRTAEYVCLFPNLWLSCTSDHFRLTLIEPLSPSRTRQRWVFFFVGDEALAPELRDARETLVERIRSVTLEDIGILEALQAGRASSGYDGGRFSCHHEATVHRFQRLVSLCLAGRAPYSS